MMTQLPPLPDGSSARMERDLFARVATHTTKTKRVRNGVIVGSAALLVAGGTVAGVTLANPFQQANSAYCYQSANTSSRYSEVSSSPDGTSNTGAKISHTATSDKTATALENCVSVWHAGILGDSTTATATSTTDLTVCIRPDQVLAVFPTGTSSTDPAQFCNTLGLDTPPDGQ